MQNMLRMLGQILSWSKSVLLLRGDQGTMQTYTSFGTWLLFSAGKAFANFFLFFFIISDTKAGVFLQDFVFILSSANSTLAVISASKI